MTEKRGLKTDAEKCMRHHKQKRGYIEWRQWAEEQTAKGKKQIQCPRCKCYFFKDEI